MADPKNIVICSDGTGNTAIKARGTNVFKIFEAVDIHSHTVNPSLTRQVAIYDDGVGTSSFKPWRLLGGALGWGLGRNVRELYAELARVYAPGDRIFLFGFSRGAFTVRTLAGLIVTCGIVDRNKCQNDICLKEYVETAYDEYRRRYRTKHSLRLPKPVDPKRAENFRDSYAVVDDLHAPEGRVPIEFIGVWDTVDAVGLPIAGLATLINDYIYRYKFPDRKLSLQVKKACHALAIDDERLTFHPEMWNEEGEEDGRIEQVWFPGVHANVGGGYPKQGISLVSLYWMMRKAQAAGLRFSEYDWTFVRDHQHPFDKLYDSRAGLAVYYRYRPRNIQLMCKDNHAVPKVHVSAVERIVQGTDGYAPGNIPANVKLEVTDPHSSDLLSVPGILESALAPDRILLERVRRWVSARELCHISLVALTLFFLALVVFRSVKREGVVAGMRRLLTGDLFSSLWNTAKDFPVFAIAAIVLAALLLAVTWLARKRMNVTFSDFWYRVHPNLLRKLS